jgi:hypothetical protein
MKMSALRASVIALLLAGTLFVPHKMVAQLVYAAIHGTVTDPTGAVIPGATVTVTNTSTGISVVRTADAAGYFTLPQLQPGGPYKVSVAATGFEGFTLGGLNLNVNDNRDVDAHLKVGTSGTTVQVSATALQVETSNTQLEQVATSAQLENLPMEGFDVTAMQKLEPGVVESSDRFGSFSSNGNQTPQNSYLLNGIDITDGALNQEGISISPEALDEENTETSTMNPEYSRNSGATVNQILKSGTNQFHGGAFEFYRDTFLNNGNYFSKTRPVFHQNVYGGTVGGPILRDKLFFFFSYLGTKNRTAITDLQPTLSNADFAGNFTADTNLISGAPNSAGLSNNHLPFDINGCPGGLTGDTWAQCFTSGTVNIAPANWNPIAANLINTYVPPANETLGTTPVFNFSPINTETEEQYIGKADFTPTKQDSIWFATVYEHQPETQALPFAGGSFPGFGTTSVGNFKLFSASWTHTFGPNMLNALRASYFRFNFPSVIPAKIIDPSSVGFDISPNLAESSLPTISTNLFAIGGSEDGPQPRTDTNLTYSDGFTWVRKAHTMKFGAQFEQFRVDNPFGFLNQGFFGYSGSGQFSSGDPSLDLALGIPDDYEQTSDGDINAVATELFGYAQDNWKVSSDVTINYGVSWDTEGPYENRQFKGLGVVCFANSSTESTVYPGANPGLSFPGDPGCNAAGGPTAHYNRFAPRVGFAWSPSGGPSAIVGAPGSHQFSIRGGIGLYYNRDQEEQSLQNLQDPPNFLTSEGAFGLGGSPSFANPFQDIAGRAQFSEANPFPFSPAPAGDTNINWGGLFNTLEISTFDKTGYTVPYTYNFNLNIQRSVGGNMVAQLGYVGSVSHRLPSFHEGDPITAAGHAACLADSSCDTISGLAEIHLLDPQYTADPAVVSTNPDGLPNGTPWYLTDGDQTTDGSSNYNSLQASLIKAPSHGLSFTLAYTWSHALDDGSGYESATGQAGAGGANGRSIIYTPGFKDLNYGSSDFDTRNRFVASYIYTIPKAAFMKNTLLRETLSGWQVSGITALQSGNPLTLIQGSTRSAYCDSFGKFGCGDNPETTSFHIPKLNPRSSGSPYFSTASFSNETIGTFGNTPRGFFSGPGFNYTNLSLTKNIHLSSDGRRYLQLRIDAFNAFNHANFANPGTDFEDPGTFGVITSVKQSADPNGDPSPGRAVQLVGKFYF